MSQEQNENDPTSMVSRCDSAFSDPSCVLYSFVLLLFLSISAFFFLAPHIKSKRVWLLPIDVENLGCEDDSSEMIWYRSDSCGGDAKDCKIDAIATLVDRKACPSTKPDRCRCVYFFALPAEKVILTIQCD